MPGGIHEERGVLSLGILVLGAALVFGVYAGVATWGDRRAAEHHRDAEVGLGRRRLGTRHRAALERPLVVEVEQLLRTAKPRGQESWQAGQPLYGASLGPNSSGEVDQTVNLSLPAGDFDDLGARAWVGDEPHPCYTRGNTTGCVRVHIPRPQERPQLSVAWETFVKAPRLLIRLKARTCRNGRRGR